jgi:tetratricopeptide (TPR) repeat protein
MMRVVTVVLGLVIALPTSGRTAEPPVAAPTRSELELGLDAYGRGDFAEALVHFERSYAERPDPATLYAWAQASRSAGKCAQAITLYQQFIEGGAAGASRDAALQNQARCREQLAAQPEPESPPPPRPVPTQGTSEPLSPSVPRDHPDRAGVALLGSGAALLAVGVGVLIAALVQHRAQRTTRDYNRFDRLDGRIDGLYIGGGVALGLGAGLVTGGAIRLRRHRR